MSGAVHLIVEFGSELLPLGFIRIKQILDHVG